MDEMPAARLCAAWWQSLSVANDVWQFLYSSVQKNYNDGYWRAQKLLAALAGVRSLRVYALLRFREALGWMM